MKLSYDKSNIAVLLRILYQVSLFFGAIDAFNEVFLCIILDIKMIANKR